MRKNRTGKNDADVKLNNLEAHKEQKDNGRELSTILYVFLAVFGALIVYLIIFTYKDSGTVINSSYNKRLNILANHVMRGQIIADDGSILAQSTIGDDGSEVRTYPYGSLFAHSVGYTYRGGLGIESMCAYSLLTSGDTLLSRVSNDLKGQKNIGNNVYTTLDPYITFAAYRAMGDNRGAIVVSNVKTGEILAIISKPDFDPNTIESEWENYNSSDDGILLNRAMLGLYPPGSTFKIVTALEFMRESDDCDSYDYDCSGSFTYDGVTINCYHGESHGNVDFEKSFAKSCNSSFANITSQLNREKFGNTCTSLLFNEDLPIPYSYKKSVVNISENSNTADLLQAGIGQGETLVTPMHMNMITSAIANKGMLMKPYVVKSVESVTGKIISETKPKEFKRFMEEDEAEKLTELMESVVEEGTATKLRDGVAYKAAGKTGSAEYSDDKQRSHAWFTGFAPADDPEVAVTVIVEDGGSGGQTAVPIAREIFNAYFDEQ